MTQKLHRTADGKLQQAFGHVEGVSFMNNPLDLFIIMARYKFILRFLEKTDHVLDAGCGLGVGSTLLSRHCKKVTAIDFDAELIANHQKNYKQLTNVEFQVKDALTLSASSERYDAAVLMDVIEHVPLEQSHQMVKGLAHVLHDGGFALIGTPNANSVQYASHRRTDSHVHEFKYGDYKEFLRPYFRRTFIFSMTDEVISQSFPELAWYFLALCVK